MKERLVNATAIVKEILEERDKIPLEVDVRYGFGTKAPNRHGQSMRGGIRKALRCVEQAPTIEIPDIVRCKECMYRSTPACPMFSFSEFKSGVSVTLDKTTSNGFCDRGRRK